VPLSVLLVDDEPLARDGLRLLLARDPDIGAMHDAKNGHEAVAAIRQSRPDLVFLDVQMPEMDGFDVVRAIGADAMPAVVFVTAHDQYAIQAFEINAIDYLLKPVTEARFATTLARVKARRDAASADAVQRQMMSLLETLASPTHYAPRFAVRTGGKTILIDVADIDWIAAAENYVELHTSRGRQLLHVTMNTIEKSLDPGVFMRVHRSAIINVRRVREVEPMMHGEYAITLSSGARVRSGRHYSDRVQALVANPF
jgi:two-component system LytT family response regulator